MPGEIKKQTDLEGGEYNFSNHRHALADSENLYNQGIGDIKNQPVCAGPGTGHDDRPGLFTLILPGRRTP